MKNVLARTRLAGLILRNWLTRAWELGTAYPAWTVTPFAVTGVKASLTRVSPTRNGLCCSMLLAGLCVVAVWFGLTANVVRAADRPQNGPPVIHVPASELDALVNRDGPGVLLSSNDFEKLLAAARQRQVTNPESGLSPAITSVNYVARIQESQLVIEATLELQQFERPFHVWPLPFGRLSVEEATLDGQSANIRRSPENLLEVCSLTPGPHRLLLTLTTEIVASGSDQLIACQLLSGPAGQFKISVPAGRQLELAAAQVSRPAPLDQEAQYTIPVGGRPDLQLRISNRTKEQAADQVVFATTAHGLAIGLGEVAWHAKTSLQIFGSPIDDLVLEVPSQVDVAAVDAVGLASWELGDGPTPDTTRIFLRFLQGIDGSREIAVRGVIRVAEAGEWSVPALVIKGVSSHVGAIHFRPQEGIRLKVKAAEGVRLLNAAQPESQPGTPAVSHYAIYNERFTLLLETSPKSAEVIAALAIALQLTEREILAQASLTLASRYAALFDADLQLPVDWELLAADLNGTALTWEKVPSLPGTEPQPGSNLIRLRLATPIPDRGTGTISLTLRRLVDGWPVDKSLMELDLPVVGLPQSSLTELAIVVTAEPQFDVGVMTLTGFETLPLQGDLERLRVAAPGTTATGRLNVTRKPARWSAETISFIRVDPQMLMLYTELLLNISGSGIREVTIQVPEELGDRLEFRPLGSDVIIREQKGGVVIDRKRPWLIRFDRHYAGPLRLMSLIQQPLPVAGGAKEATRNVTVQTLSVEGANPEFQLIAVEASAEQQLEITATDTGSRSLSEIDSLEVAAVGYQPKERLVAAYRSPLGSPRLQIKAIRFDREAMPAAVVKQLDIRSVLGPNGELQHVATFDVQATGVQSLLLKLPADSELWGAMLDGVPVELRQVASGYSIPFESSGVEVLPMSAIHSSHNSRVVSVAYRTSAGLQRGISHLTQEAPTVTAITGMGAGMTVPVLQQRWGLAHPVTEVLTASSGRLEPTAPLARLGWWPRWLSRLNAPSLSRLLIVVVVVAIALTLVWSWRFSMAQLGVWRTVGLAVLLLLLTPVIIQFGFSTSRSYSLASRFRIDSRIDEFGMIEEEGLRGSTQAGEWKEPQMGQPAEKAATSFFYDLPKSKDAKNLGLEPNQPAKPSGPMGPTATNSPNGMTAPASGPIPPAAPVAAPLAVLLGRKAPPGTDKPVEKGKVALGQQARLSLSITIEPPAGSAQHHFQYSGTAAATEGTPALSITLVSERLTAAVRMLTAALTALVLWLLRSLNWRGRIGMALLGITAVAIGNQFVPLAGLGLFDGLVLGGLVGLGLWIVNFVLKSLSATWGRIAAKVRSMAAPHSAAGLLAVGSLLTCATTMAQEGAQSAPTPEERPVISAPVFAVVSEDKPGQVPTFERFFLPQARYLELLRLAGQGDALQVPPDFGSRVSHAIYLADVNAAVMSKEEAAITLTARYVVYHSGPDPAQVALPIHSVALVEATLNNAPATVVSVPREGGLTGFAVTITKPGIHLLDAQFLVPARSIGTAGEFSIPLTPVPVGRLVVRLPDDKLRLRINGSSSAYRKQVADGKTTIELPIDQTATLGVSWQPDFSATVGTTIHVESLTAVAIDDSGVRQSTGVEYRVRQGAMTEAVFRLPEVLKLQGVYGPDVGGWELANDGPTRLLKVLLRRSVGDSTRLTIDSLWLGSLDGLTAATSLPLVTPAEATHETGHLGLFADANLGVKVTQITGLTQRNADQFPQTVPVTRPTSSPVFVYRFAARPVGLDLQVTRTILNQVVAAEHGLQLGTSKQSIASRFTHKLTGGAVSTFEYDLPAGWQVQSVVASNINDWFVTKAGDKQKLTIEVSPPVSQLAEVLIGATKNESLATQPLSVVVPQFTGASQLTSQLAIWPEPSLTTLLSDRGSWSVMQIDQAAAPLLQLKPTVPQFVLRTTQLQPSAVVLTSQPASAKVTGNTIGVIAVTETVLGYSLLMEWSVENAAVDTFYFTAPDWLAAKLSLTGDQMRSYRVLETVAGQTRLEVRTKSAITGRFLLSGAANLPAATSEVVAPQLVLHQSTGKGLSSPLTAQQHFSLLTNLSDSQLLRTSERGATPITRDQVPLAIPAPLLDQATELLRLSSDDEAIRWTLSRPEPTKPIPASVNVADLLTVVARDGTYRTQATFTIKNRLRQFLPVRLPANAKLLTTIVASAPALAVVDPQKPGVLLVPLPKTSSADLSFPVVVTYSGELPQALPAKNRLTGSTMQLPLAEIISAQQDGQLGIPVARTVVRVFLPDDLWAMPVDQPQLHNLNVLAEAGEALIYQRAAIDELNDLISVVNQNGNSSIGVQALTNSITLVEQLGRGEAAVTNNTAIPENERRQLAEEQALTINRFRVLQSEQQGQSNPGSAGVNGRNLKLNLQQQAEVAFGNGDMLYRSNRGQPVDLSDGVESDGLARENAASDFRFKELAVKRELGRKSDSEPQAQPALPSIEARQAYRSQNYSTLNKLSKSQAGSTAGKRAMQMQAGGYDDNGNGVYSDESGFGAGSGSGRSGMGGGRPGDAPISAENESPFNAQADTRRQISDFDSTMPEDAAAGRRASGLSRWEVRLGEFDGERGAAVAGRGLEFAGQIAERQSARGLGLAIAIPTTGQRLQFVKSGGDAKLMLSVASRGAAQDWWPMGMSLAIAAWALWGASLVLLARRKVASTAWGVWSLTAVVAFTLFWPF